MATPVETCENCGKQIGKLETAMVHGDNVVCPKCWKALNGEADILARQPSAHPLPVPPMPMAQAVHIPPVQVAIQSIQPRAKGTSGFGVAALVLGLIAAIVCWVPFIGLVSLPIAGIGLLLALMGLIVSLTGQRSSVGMPVAGGATCTIAIFVAILSTSGFTAAIANANQQRLRTNQTAVQRPAMTLQPIPQRAAPAPSEQWASADHPMRNGGVEISVVSLKVGKVPLTTLFDVAANSEDQLLAITINLKNVSDSKKIDYRSMAGTEISYQRNFSTLKDDKGNSYKRIDFGASKPAGRLENESLYPGQTKTDILVFEPPIDSASKLFLEMPAANFGGEGMIRFEIPAAAVKRG